MYIQDKMEEYADEIFSLLDEVGGGGLGCFVKELGLPFFLV